MPEKKTKEESKVMKKATPKLPSGIKEVKINSVEELFALQDSRKLYGWKPDIDVNGKALSTGIALVKE